MASPSPDPRLLLVCSDLFFSTQLRSAAQSAGATVDVELSAARIVERTTSAAYSLIVIDLEITGLDIAAVLSKLPAENCPPVVAFGPHVQTQRLKAARDAGCEHVVPRSIAAETVEKLVGSREGASPAGVPSAMSHRQSTDDH